MQNFNEELSIACYILYEINVQQRAETNYFYFLRLIKSFQEGSLYEESIQLNQVSYLMMVMTLWTVLSHV